MTHRIRRAAAEPRRPATADAGAHGRAGAATAADSAHEREAGSTIKTACLVAGAAVYLIAFFAADPTRVHRFSLLLLPDQIVSSWVAGQGNSFQLSDRWPLVAVAGLILLLAYVVGRMSLNVVGADQGLCRFEGGVFSLAAGLALWSLATLVVGLAGGLHGPWLRVAAAAATAAWMLWRYRHARRTGRRACESLADNASAEHGFSEHGSAGDTSPQGRSADGWPSDGDPGNRGLANCPTSGAGRWPWLERFGLWLGLPFLLLILFGAMLPPWDFDVREYHLQVPKEWYQAGQITFLPHNVYGNMPLGAELLAVLAMALMPGEQAWWWGALAGKLVMACYVPLTALGLLAAGRRFATRAAGTVAALTYISVPWMVFLPQAGLIEGVVACYLFFALYAFGIWVCGPNRRWHDRRLGLAGFLAGAAAACKYPPLVFVVAPLAVAVPCLANGHRWRAAVVFLATASVGCGLWYGKNWAATGNPVYPLVFGGTSRTPELIERWNHAHRVPPDAAGRRYSLSQAVSAVADFGWRNTWQSPLLAPLLAAALLCAPRRRLVLTLAGYALYFLAAWWLVTHRVDRFWTPLLPVMAGLAGLGAVWPTGRGWRWTVTALGAVGLTTNLLFLLSAGVYDHRYLVGLEQLRLDEPREPGEPSRVSVAHRYLNRHAVVGDRVLLVGDAEPFDLEMPAVYNTCFDPCIFEQWLAGRTGEQRRAILRAQRIRYVLVSWSEIDRYRSPGNYGFSDYVTKTLVRDELVGEQRILRPIDLGVDPDVVELFEVVGASQP